MGLGARMWPRRPQLGRMCVCVIVCMHSCANACVYVCMCVYMHVCLHACMYVCICVCMHVGMQSCVHICGTDVYDHACMYVCVSVYVCMRACMYVCLCAGGYIARLVGWQVGRNVGGWLRGLRVGRRVLVLQRPRILWFAALSLPSNSRNC